uniref:Uncharacterized protein n=1 Tax=Panagrolaimus davidi TaxID=227884 RepID=A0A914QJ48_9BILA
MCVGVTRQSDTPYILFLQLYSTMDVNNIALHSLSTSDTPIYTFKHPYPQRFSVPFNVIKYMIKNCKSGKVWKKLIMLCKYFYSNNPVFPVKHLIVNANLKCKAVGENFDASRLIPKLWLYDSLSANSGSKMSTLIPKIFKFDLHVLQIVNQNLTLGDYQKLTSSGSRLTLWDSTIKNEDDTLVTADKLLEDLGNLHRCTMNYSNNLLTLQTETIKKIVQHLNGYKKMCAFQLFAINESFDFASFSDFLLKNETVCVYLRYVAPVSYAYKEIVENVIKKIKKNPSLKVPKILFYGDFY